MSSKRAGCIYCDKPTGSEEHVLPAAIGGLHTNRGILCGECNRELGRTVDAHFAAQLRPLSALIGVRNREGTPVAVDVVDAASGFVYAFEDGGVLRHKEPATTTDTVVDGIRTVGVLTSTQHQADALVHRMRADRATRVVSRTKVKALFVQHPTVPFRFGSPDDFRGAARWAFNVLAHHYPAFAREVGMAGLKAFIRGAPLSEPFAWHAGCDEASALAPDTFSFQHRIVLSFDPETSTAHAHATFLGVVAVGVSFGTVTDAPRETIVHEADVLATEVRKSYSVRRFPVVTPLATIATDPRIRTSAAIGTLVEKRRARSWAEDAPALVAEIEAALARPPADAYDAIFEVLDRQEQRILNLAADIVRADHGAEHAQRRALANVFRNLLTPDPAHPSGVDEQTRFALGHFRHEIADAIVAHSAEGKIDPVVLWDILEGERGCAVLRRAALEQVVAAGARRGVVAVSDGDPWRHVPARS